MPLNLKNGCFLIERGPVALFRFSGPDHVRYLHNRLTQEVKSLAAGKGAQGLCLSPNGRIQAQLIILKDENSIDILTGPLTSMQHSAEVGSAEVGSAEVKSAILQFKVADQLECQDLSADILQLTLLGAGVKSLASILGIELIASEKFSHFTKEFDGAELRMINNSVLGLDALEIVGASEAINQLKSMSAMFGVLELDASSVELLRVLSREWRFGVDVDEKTLAAEVALDELVSFKKGCYPGQEVVEMSISRGRPNRSLELFTSKAKVVVGSEVQAGEKSVGKITSAVYLEDEESSFFLTRLKTEFLSSTDLAVDGTACRIVPTEEIVSRIAPILA